MLSDGRGFHVKRITSESAAGAEGEDAGCALANTAILCRAGRWRHTGIGCSGKTGWWCKHGSTSLCSSRSRNTAKTLSLLGETRRALKEARCSTYACDRGPGSPCCDGGCRCRGSSASYRARLVDVAQAWLAHGCISLIIAPGRRCGETLACGESTGRARSGEDRGWSAARGYGRWTNAETR